MWHVLLFLVLLVLCSTYSIARGGTPERIGTAILLAGIAATALVARVQSERFLTVEAGILLVDLAVCAAYLALALKADRFWPMGSAAVIGIGVLAHLAFWAAPTLIPKVYGVAHSLSGYPAALLPAIGTFRHRRRIKAHGIDPSWSRSSDRSSATGRGSGPTSY